MTLPSDHDHLDDVIGCTLPALAEDGVPVSDDFVEPPREVYEQVDLAEEQLRFDEGDVRYEPPRSDIEWDPVEGRWRSYVYAVEPEHEALPNPDEPETEELMEWREVEEYLDAHARWWRRAASKHGSPPCDFAPGAVAVWTEAALESWLLQHRAGFEGHETNDTADDGMRDPMTREIASAGHHELREAIEHGTEE